MIGNLIGTTADGTAGTDATRNGVFGVNLEGNEQCLLSCPDDIAFNSVIDNVIVGSETNVIMWKGATSSLVEGNSIGALVNGARPASAGVSRMGVMIEVGANRNLISRNIIAHMANGIHMRADDPLDSFNGSFPVFGNRSSRNSIHDIDGGLGSISSSPVA